MEFDCFLLQIVSPAFETKHSLAGISITMSPCKNVLLFNVFFVLSWSWKYREAWTALKLTFHVRSQYPPIFYPLLPSGLQNIAGRFCCSVMPATKGYDHVQERTYAQGCGNCPSVDRCLAGPLLGRWENMGGGPVEAGSYSRVRAAHVLYCYCSVREAVAAIHLSID